MLVLASYICLGLIAIESLVAFNIWHWPEVRARLEGRRAAVRRHSETMQMLGPSSRSRSGLGLGQRRRSVSLLKSWMAGGKGSASDGGGDDGREEEERERGWAHQLMASIVRKRSAAAGGGGVGSGLGGVAGSRGGVANNGDGHDDDLSFRRDKRSLARGGRDGASATDPSSGDGAATGASGSGRGGTSGASGSAGLPLPLPLPPPRNDGAVVVPRTSFASGGGGGSGAASGTAAAANGGGGDALFLETELEKALYHWRAWRVDVVSFCVIGSLYIVVAVLIFFCSVLAQEKSEREFSYSN